MKHFMTWTASGTVACSGTLTQPGLLRLWPCINSPWPGSDVVLTCSLSDPVTTAQRHPNVSRTRGEIQSLKSWCCRVNANPSWATWDGPSADASALLDFKCVFMPHCVHMLICLEPLMQRNRVMIHTLLESVKSLCIVADLRSVPPDAARSLTVSICVSRSHNTPTHIVNAHICKLKTASFVFCEDKRQTRLCAHSEIRS